MTEFVAEKRETGGFVYQPQRFRGVVHLKEWMRLSDGKNYIGVFGWVTISTAEEAFGFSTGPKESTWFAMVHGDEEIEDESSFISLLGCQIRGFEKLKPTWGLDRDIFRVDKSKPTVEDPESKNTEESILEENPLFV